MQRLTCLIPIVFACIVAGCARQAPQTTSAADPVSLAVVNARIWTGDASRPWAEALAITGGQISLVGSSDQVRQAVGTAESIDAGGRLIVPGFIDTHVHFIDGGFRLSCVQLRDAKTREEFVSRVKAFAATVPDGTWIRGGDWDHTLWGGELPTRDWIDSVTPDHPVWISRLDGHMALANSAALRAAGITRSTKAIAGGEIVRSANGEPTGILKDNAMSLVDAVALEPSTELKEIGRAHV